MMQEVYLCCSPADREVAAAISARLERGAEVRVSVDDGETETVAVKWESGLSSAAILLLLSPEAVPPRVSRAEWGALLDYVTARAEPPVGSLLVRECGYPRILERRHFFRWDGGQGLRALERWALALHTLPQERSFVPARLPWFEGRERELGTLWDTLVDASGAAVVLNPAPASGKTSLAQEFCRQAGAHFRDIMWIACGDRSPAAIAADLAEWIGVECQGEDDEAFAELLRLAGRHRVLLVFDDVQPGMIIPADPEGRASVLATTRSAEVQASARVIRIENGAELPTVVPENPVDLRLWRAMAVCRPTGFPLELAARIADVGPADLPEACARLIQGRLADPLGENGLMRLSALSIAAAGDSLEMERRRHAEAVLETACAAEFMPALRWAVSSDWEFARRLVRKAFALLRQCGRLAESAELLIALRDAADARGEWQVSDECSWELSWIRGVPYRGTDRTSVRGDQMSFDFGG